MKVLIGCALATAVMVASPCMAQVSVGDLAAKAAMEEAAADAVAALEEAVTALDEPALETSGDTTTSLDPAMQDVFDRGCGDDRGKDRCDPDVQAKMHTIYGLQGPKNMLAQNTSMRRAMFVDGYGNDVVAITFARIPGQSPTVSIATQQRPDAPERFRFETQPLQAVIDAKTWEEVQSRSAHFDKALASEMPPKEGEQRPFRMCLHGWFSVVEAVDAPRPSPNTIQSTFSSDGEEDETEQSPMIDGRISVKSQGACSDGLAIAYAWELMRIAHENIAECSTLPLSRFRNAAELLAYCHTLSGDRLAAGEASVLHKELEQWAYFKRDKPISHLFAGLMGNEDKAAKFADALQGSFMALRAPEAKGAHDVTIKGYLIYEEPEKDQNPDVADISINLTRQMDDFVIKSWDIGKRMPFKTD